MSTGEPSIGAGPVLPDCPSIAPPPICLKASGQQPPSQGSLEKQPEHRILVIDDNPKIHNDFRRILCPPEPDMDFENIHAELFGEPQPVPSFHHFDIDSAYQGQEGLAKVEQAVVEARPYSMAFVDVRMPPGWDGIETIRHLWKSYPELQVVICTAYSDYSWESIVKELGESDSLLILKKPFDNVEVLQLAHALTKKWWLGRRVTARLANLDELVKIQTKELSEANAKLLQEIEQKAHAEEALRQSEERFSKAFQASPIPLAIVSTAAQVFQEANDSFLSMSSLTRSDLLGQLLQKLIIFPDAQSEKSVQEQFHSRSPVRKVACQMQRANQEVRDTLLSAEPLSLGDSQSWLLLVEDITDQLRLEAQLRQSQKMQAVGQLAAGVAHDFNNILMIIQGYTTVQLANTQLDERVAKSFQKVNEAARRAASLTGQLLAFSRQQRIRVVPLDLNAILAGFQEILTRCVTGTTTLEFHYAADLPKLAADPVNIEQLVMNLAVNARDAMPTGGRLSIKTRLVELGPKTVHTNPESRPGKFVCLSVSDTGCGMDRRTKERIFEPFFTTKGVGKGTGLGLATVYGIVKQHEGWLEVESQLGAGTTFTIYFPALEQPTNPQLQDAA